MIAQFYPDYTDLGQPSVFIQWKGTNVCLDFYCECGMRGHFDGDFAYALRCSSCGREYMMPHTVSLIPRPADYQGVMQEPDMEYNFDNDLRLAPTDA